LLWANLHPIEGKPDMQIGKLEDVPPFYDAVMKAVWAGELDAEITALQNARSDALRGKTKKAA
jgi:hypothetical protein